MKSMHLLGDFYHKVQCKQDSKTQQFAKLLGCDGGQMRVIYLLTLLMQICPSIRLENMPGCGGQMRIGQHYSLYRIAALYLIYKVDRCLAKKKKLYLIYNIVKLQRIYQDWVALQLCMVQQQYIIVKLQRIDEDWVLQVQFVSLAISS